MSEYTLQQVRKMLVCEWFRESDPPVLAIDAAIAREAELREENEKWRNGHVESEKQLAAANDEIGRLMDRIIELEAAGAQGVPDGWKLVPIEPTDQMMRAARETGAASGWLAAYRAMLVAAPVAENAAKDGAK